MSSTLAFTSEGHMQEKNRGGGNGPAETDKDNFQRFWMILAHERTKHIVNINAVFIYIIYIYIYTYIYIYILLYIILQIRSYAPCCRSQKIRGALRLYWFVCGVGMRLGILKQL